MFQETSNVPMGSLRNRMFPKDHAVKQSMATYSKVFQQVLMSLMQSHFE